jgi:uncharacterized protein YeaO (DUF488 family)
MTFRIKRVYESASPSDGKRVLVDRLWPRGYGAFRLNVERSWMPS